MREETVTYKIFQYAELSDSAKQTAIEWFLTDYPDHEWWDCTYEDAETIGLKITSFELDRSLNADGYINIHETDCADNILVNHSEDCETFKTAKKFLADLKALRVNVAYTDKDSTNGLNYEGDCALQELYEEFKKALLSDYADMLQKECEHLQSEEHAIEMIEANEYDFHETGKRY